MNVFTWIIDRVVDRVMNSRVIDDFVERSVGAMAIAEGDEGWEKIPIDCPMLKAVSDLRKAYDKLLTNQGCLCEGPAGGPHTNPKCQHYGCICAYEISETRNIHWDCPRCGKRWIPRPPVHSLQCGCSGPEGETCPHGKVFIEVDISRFIEFPKLVDPDMQRTVRRTRLCCDCPGFSGTPHTDPKCGYFIPEGRI